VSVSGAFLRGANRGQTLVLIDGVRIASSSAGATSLEAIPLDQIERIEILRGPASSLYGADAIGGVIQVFTRRGSGDFSANATAGYGTYATSNLTAGMSGSAGPLRLSLQAGAKKSAGFNAIADRVHVHDLHATILHLLGFDHTKLTYRFQGRDFRLTDVSGHVVEKLLA